MKKKPRTIAHELKMNEQTVHNVIDKYENWHCSLSAQIRKKRKLSDAQVRQAVRKAKKGKNAKSLKKLKSMWISGLYNEDFEKQGYSTEKS